MSHTPEPWLINKVASDEVGTICREMTQEYGMLVPHLNTFGDKYKENARRIVACVNACAGVPNELLDSISYKSQADMKVAAIESEVVAISQRDTYRDLCAKLISSARAKLEASNLNEHVKAKFELELAIIKAEKILNPEQAK